MKGIVSSILVVLFLLFPIITVSLLMELYDFGLKMIIKETLFNVAMLAFILLLVSVVKKNIFKNIIALVLLIPFYCVLFVKFFALFHFFNFIDNAVLYTVFETNYEETRDFLNGYSKWYYYFFVLLYFYGLLKIVFKNTFIPVFRNKWSVYSIVFLVCCFISYRFYERSLSLLILNTFVEYKIYSKEIAKEISKKQSPYFTNVTNTDDEALYVVVIGESTTKNNMGIYGYYRKTNPYLQQIENELYVFKDVISPHTQTVLSLDKIFSMADYDHPENNKLGTIIQLANQAGFKTYWLSNQKPVGAYESLTSLYAKASKSQFYVSNFYDKSIKYDEVLLPKLKEIIREKDRKKMIFLHLQGTHFSYEQRYPETFQFFKKHPQTKFPSEEAFKLINDYDNAVRYNDYIIYQIIDKVKKEQKNSFVVYFSDHGEEVFRTMKHFGHHESIATNPMFEIPFIVWTSDKYNNKSTINFSGIHDRKYHLEDFIFSFAELSRIGFDQFQSQKSIFNTEFKPKKRMILKNIDYDQRLEKK